MDTSTPLDSENEHRVLTKKNLLLRNLQMQQQQYLRPLLKQDQRSSHQETGTKDFCKYKIKEYFELNG